MPEGVRSVSVFLVNRRQPIENDLRRDAAFIFQANLELRADLPFVRRPNLIGLATDDWDEKVVDLQYRDLHEHAVGHGIASEVIHDPDGECRRVRTTWIPRAEVERVAPSPIPGVTLAMEELGNLADTVQARAALEPLVHAYRAWIDGQEAAAPTDLPARADTARGLMQNARLVADRIQKGIEALEDPLVLDAFRIANRAMAVTRRRTGVIEGRAPDPNDLPSWRPFQLAFVLMNIASIVTPTDPDREIVDLLFFPTGGGKTEAYLGLALHVAPAHARSTEPGGDADLRAGKRAGADACEAGRVAVRDRTLGGARGDTESDGTQGRDGPGVGPCPHDPLHER
jgi:hypothetical protein